MLETMTKNCSNLICDLGAFMIWPQVTILVDWLLASLCFSFSIILTIHLRRNPCNCNGCWASSILPCFKQDNILCNSSERICCNPCNWNDCWACCYSPACDLGAQVFCGVLINILILIGNVLNGVLITILIFWFSVEF